MKTGLEGHVGEQHVAYRRGMVLGLTMAEVGILIIFILLLLIAFDVYREQMVAQANKGKTLIEQSRLTQLESASSSLAAITESLGEGPNALPKEIEKLVRVVQEATRNPEAQSDLQSAKTELQKIKRARERIEKVAAKADESGASKLAQAIEDQAFELSNKEGQLSLAERRLADVGLGKGERPCWVQPTGTIDYLFDVVLASDGIRVREYATEHRTIERASLPVRTFDPSQTLSPSQFLRDTKALFDYSKERDCRFFVVIYDATAVHEKPLYKSLLRTVEGHFYKRLDYGTAPF